MLVCDYNGWADAPEDEREALDALELGPGPAPPPSSTASLPLDRSYFRWPRRRPARLAA
jgi:hypothetical protein